MIDDKVTPNCRIIDATVERFSSLKAKDLGSILKKPTEILEKAYSTMRNMGLYNCLLNNCQDYCKTLAKEFGCPNDFDTATEAVIQYAAVGIGAVAIGAALYYVFKKDDSSK